MAFAYYGARLDREQAKIAGIALSTTSLAVVYAVLVETGLNRTTIGKRLMAATFVTDLGTVAALSILFITPSCGSSRSSQSRSRSSSGLPGSRRGSSRRTGTA